MSGEFAIAVHALVFLDHVGTMISSEALAENVCTNPARIRKVLAKLKKGGFVETKEGTSGGYQFVKDPSTVTLKQICQVMEVKPVSVTWRSGDINMKCLIASGIAGVMDAIYDELNDTCKEKLADITIADISNQVLKEKKEE